MRCAFRLKIVKIIKSLVIETLISKNNEVCVLIKNEEE